MDFGLNEEQKALQNAVREFLTKEAKNIARETEDSEEGYSPELWKKMANLGWMGVSFPEEYGGTGGNFVDLVVLLEEMGKMLVPGPFIPSVICSGHVILKYGNGAQKEELLHNLTSGKLMIAPALIRPDFSLNELFGKDKISWESRDYILSGSRLFVPYAHMADWFLYGTETDEGKTLFLIDAKSSGVHWTLVKTIASDKQFEVSLNRVRLAEGNIVGEKGKGEEIFREIDELGSLCQCGFILGMLEQVLKMTVDYAKQRVQFERPIGSFQAVQHHCADMAIDIDQVKFLTYQAAWKLSEQLPAKKEISMAKARASDASRRVCLLGIKIHGGIGIVLDYDMQLYFRKAKAAEVAFGDGDFHREILAQQLGL